MRRTVRIKRKSATADNGRYLTTRTTKRKKKLA